MRHYVLEIRTAESVVKMSDSALADIHVLLLVKILREGKKNKEKFTLSILIQFLKL